MLVSARGAVAAICCVLLSGCGQMPLSSQTRGLPAGMHEVKPVPSRAASETRGKSATPPAQNLRIGQARFFSYALPEGWRLGEDGQFAMTLVAPDDKAFTVMVGNAGLPPNYPPPNFVYEKLTAMQPQNLRLSPARQAAPVAGFARAYEFDVDYAVRGVPYHGIVKCHVTTAYDTAVMAMTGAIAQADQWPGYAPWLPLVADQLSARDGGAFGMRGIMAQNLNNSTAYAEAARQYRDWSQRNWQQVTNERNASQDKNNAAFRENLGGV